MSHRMRETNCVKMYEKFCKKYSDCKQLNLAMHNFHHTYMDAWIFVWLMFIHYSNVIWHLRAFVYQN